MKVEPDLIGRKKIGEFLKQVRNQSGKKLRDLEDENISRATISYIENGRDNVKIGKIKYYCSLLGVDFNQLPKLIENEENKVLAIRKKYLEFISPIETYIESSNKNKGLSKLKSIKNPHESIQHIILYLKGRCYVQQNKMTQAKKCFIKAINHIEKHPNLANDNIQSCCYNQLGKICYYQNDFKKAIHYTEKGLESFIAEGERKHIKSSLLMNKIIYLERLGHLPEAQILLKELWEKEDEIENVEVVLNMHDVQAQVYRKSKMYSEAIDVANQGIRKAQINKKLNRIVELWSTLANIYIDMNEHSKAECILQLALELEKNVEEKHIFLHIYIQLGHIYIKQGKYDEAKNILEEAIKRKHPKINISRYTQALTVLGDCFLKQGDYKGGIQPYTEALSLARKHSLIYHEREILRKLCVCWKHEDINKFQKNVVKYFELDVKLSDEGGDLID